MPLRNLLSLSSFAATTAKLGMAELSIAVVSMVSAGIGTAASMLGTAGVITAAAVASLVLAGSCVSSGKTL